MVTLFLIHSTIVFVYIYIFIFYLCSFFFSVSFGVRPMGRSKTAYYVRLFES